MRKQNIHLIETGRRALQTPAKATEELCPATVTLVLADKSKPVPKRIKYTRSERAPKEIGVGMTMPFDEVNTVSTD